ncbi:hypothetical protein [Atopobium fossor]|uniref:hypothetical protein n=1 Tax=Atopobium fossor TaxID=39487 RepID=UPI00040A82C4|nr:hypothetical protein [Atopobium fossor]
MKITKRTFFIAYLVASALFILVCGVFFIRLPQRIGEYAKGSSAAAAMGSPTMQSDAHYGFIYKLEYEDKDEEGNTQYHFISTGGENVPKVVVAKFYWQDRWSWEVFPTYHPAGWYYYTVNHEEWEIAFIRWIKSPDYDGRELPYEYQEYAHIQ